MLGLLDGHALALAHGVHPVVSGDDHIVRNEFQGLDHAADHRHGPAVRRNLGVDVAGAVDVHGLHKELVQGRVVHCPPLATAGEGVLGLSECGEQFLEQGDAGAARGRNGDDVPAVQVGPRSRVCRVIRRLRSLCKACDNADGHFGAGSVENSLVIGIADRSAELCRDVIEQIEVSVFKQRIRDLEEAAELEAVQLYFVVAKIQLVQSRISLCPDSFCESSVNPFPGLSGNRDVVNVFLHLGVLIHDLCQIRQDRLGDQHFIVADASGLADVANRRDKCPHLLVFKQCVAFHDVHVTQSHSGVHNCSPPFNVVVFRRNARRILRRSRASLLILFCCEVSFQLCDLCFKICDRRVVRFTFCGERIDFTLHRSHLFLGGRFADRGLQFRLARLEFLRFLSQGFEVRVLGVNPLPEHQGFQCHDLLLSALRAPSRGVRRAVF